jgi:uncharacterized protein (DUF2252 family)
VPRSLHAEWRPGPGRLDPIGVLEAQAHGQSRVPELVPIRYARMAQSPFAFFRGAAAVMATDLASTPSTGIRVQACGDAHVSNFGKFATPERNLIFDVNDFDETLPGPWEWDVKRLCASLHVVARQRGFDPARCERVVTTASRAYRRRLAGYSTMLTLELWQERTEVKDVIAHFPAKYRPLVRRDVRRARRKDHRRALAKLTQQLSGGVRFLEDPPLLLRLENTDVDMQDVVGVVEGYRESLSEDCRDLFDRFEVVDVARKVVGVGSVGTWCWIALLQGPDHPDGDRLIFQVKEAQSSVLAPYAGESKFAHQGKRVVVGQRRTQAASDRFLGWAEAPSSGRQYYVRQLWDSKGQGDPMLMDLRNLSYYGALCAGTLARAHARTGDAVQISAYVGTSDAFDRAMASFAAAYAHANEQDHAALVLAIADGRVDASTD